MNEIITVNPSTSTLCLHAGAREVSRAELDSIPAPDPTETWFPVSHGVCVRTVEDALKSANFAIRAMRFGLSRGDARLFAVADLDSQLADGVSLSVGIRNSCDKSLPLGFCAGNRVFVCDNLAFRSELLVKRRHTRNGRERYQEAICAGISQLVQFAAHEERRIQSLRALSITDQWAESFVLRSFERGILNTRTLLPVLQEYREPSYDEFRARNAWNLLNAFTTVLGDRALSNPQEHAALTMRLSGLFDECAGVQEFRAAESVVTQAS